MRIFFLAWQNQLSRRWFPVGRLQVDEGRHVFEYIHGAKAAERDGFRPLVCFPDLSRRYESTNWFPLFENRIMPSTRPDFQEFVSRLNLDPATAAAEPLQVLARCGGTSATDSLEVFAEPVVAAEGRYVAFFFAKGLAHLDPHSEEAVLSLSAGDILRLTWDYQNHNDPNAMLLLTAGSIVVGWVPRYLAVDVMAQGQEGAPRTPDALVTVEKVNPAPAPIQQRLFCRFEARWQAAPFSTGPYIPLVTTA